MADYITAIRTVDGDKQIDYNALANKPDLSLSGLGAAAAGHKHSASDVTSGTLSVERGGTGKSSWTSNRLMYPSGSTTMSQLAFPSSNNSVLCQNTSGAPYWKPLSDLGLYNIGDVVLTTRTDLGDKWYLCNGDPMDVANHPEYAAANPIPIDSPYFQAVTTSGSQEDPLVKYNNFGLPSCVIHDVIEFPNHTFYNLENSSISSSNRYWVAIVTNSTGQYKFTRTTSASTSIHYNTVKLIDNYYFASEDYNIHVWDMSLNEITISSWPSTVQGGYLRVEKDPATGTLYVMEDYDDDLDIFTVNLSAKTATKACTLGVSSYKFGAIYNGIIYYSTGGSNNAYLKASTISSGTQLSSTNIGTYSDRWSSFVHNNYLYFLPNSGGSTSGQYAVVKLGESTVNVVTCSGLSVSDGSSSTHPALTIRKSGDRVYFLPTGSSGVNTRYLWIFVLSNGRISTYYRINVAGTGYVGSSSMELVSTNSPALVLKTDNTTLYQTNLLPAISLDKVYAYIKMR